MTKRVDEPPEPVTKTASVVAGSLVPPVVQRFRLRGLNGELEGKFFDSSSDRLQIGSHPLNEVEVHDRTVSRFHCEVFIDREGRAWVKDLGSRNGTRVNGVRIREAELQEGMVLRIGQLELIFTPLAERNELPVAALSSFGTLVGSSMALRSAFAILQKAAGSDVTVLLTGESGTGKSEAAELIHEQSGRAGKPFRVVDCGAVPANLLESELFGHERGAFTGAVQRRVGVFEEAEGGTVFLDEVGELPPELQPKLLRVLEAREVRRIGSNRYVPVNVRLIAATNRDLRAEVNTGRFRPDLFFRLAVITVRLPALRERPDDVPLIARRLLERLTLDEATRKALTDPAFLARLRLSPWPGNVRELRNHLERCAVLQETLQPSPEEPSPQALDALDVSIPFSEARRRLLATFEKNYVRELLERHGGNVSQAAATAGVDRAHLHRIMRRHPTLTRAR
ncbi:MAG TPA: sigma 54-interacting transcriptional regulator [Myxococcaceae bacterium]|nr:sigma 54-interacting transcriptional regulator [Myxococcaceae bacterium]